MREIPEKQKTLEAMRREMKKEAHIERWRVTGRDQEKSSTISTVLKLYGNTINYNTVYHMLHPAVHIRVLDPSNHYLPVHTVHGNKLGLHRTLNSQGCTCCLRACNV